MNNMLRMLQTVTQSKPILYATFRHVVIYTIDVQWYADYEAILAAGVQSTAISVVNNRWCIQENIYRISLMIYLQWELFHWKVFLCVWYLGALPFIAKNVMTAYAKKIN